MEDFLLDCRQSGYGMLLYSQNIFSEQNLYDYRFFNSNRILRVKENFEKVAQTGLAHQQR